jgi:F-type H+-transporting ATPase subunit a
MVLATVLICVMLHLGTKDKKLIPSIKQSACEMLFEFVGNMISGQIGKTGLRYTPYILSLFVFLLGMNLIGLTPYSFTATSQIIVTFTLAMVVFTGMTVIGLLRHGAEFYRIFCPPGVPWFIMPIIVPVEIISYLIKPVSLAIRLCANMTAGHILLKVIAAGAVSCATSTSDFLKCGLIIPVALNVVLVGFEIFVAALQAYIFTMLSCIYLNNVIHLE